jgi:hypothetical protein
VSLVVLVVGRLAVLLLLLAAILRRLGSVTAVALLLAVGAVAAVIIVATHACDLGFVETSRAVKIGVFDIKGADAGDGGGGVTGGHKNEHQRALYRSHAQSARRHMGGKSLQAGVSVGYMAVAAERCAVMVRECSEHRNS